MSTAAFPQCSDEPRRSQAILTVSFGAGAFHGPSQKDFRTPLETAVQNAFPGVPVFHAWASEQLRNQEAFKGAAIESTAGALLRIRDHGIRHVLIQPLFVIPGKEYKELSFICQSFYGSFSSLRLNAPLLAREKDLDPTARAVIQEFPFLSDDEMLVLMGHGTAGPGDAASLYRNLDLRFKELGHKNIFLGTMTQTSAVEKLLKTASERRPKQILLAPFLLSAGHHARKEMAGEDASSWKSRFEAAGFPTVCIMKGLSLYPGIQSLFIHRIQVGLAGL